MSTSRHQKGDCLALDRASVRSLDEDGHMRVEITPISKANVCPYYGAEIPGCEELGLNPEAIYQMYRHPEALAAAAPTFAGKPLLLVHIPVSAEEHPRESTIGAVGDHVEFDGTYLKANLTIWDKEAIDLVNSGKQRELSSSYRYTPDMTPGVVNGEKYDGVMRDISANHVALVERGRAGPDVYVMDSAISKPNTLESTDMSKTVLSKKTESLLATVKPFLAADAKLDDLQKLLIALDAEKKDDDEDDKAKDKAKDAEKDCATGMDDDPDAMDEDDDEDEKKKAEDDAEEMAEAKKEEKKAKDRKAKDARPRDSKMVSKEAMDAAISIARKQAADEATKHVLRVQREIDEAREAVAPHVGKLKMSFDSAEAVYRKAFAMKGIDVATIKDAAALPVLLKNLPVPSSAQTAPRIAADSKASGTSLETLFPGLDRSHFLGSV